MGCYPDLNREIHCGIGTVAATASVKDNNRQGGVKTVKTTFDSWNKRWLTQWLNLG